MTKATGMTDKEAWQDFISKAGTVSKEKGDYPNQISDSDKIDLTLSLVEEIKTDTSRTAEVLPEITGDMNALEAEGEQQEELGMAEEDTDAYGTMNEDLGAEEQDTTNEYSDEEGIDTSAESTDGDATNGIAPDKADDNTSDDKIPVDTDADIASEEGEQDEETVNIGKSSFDMLLKKSRADSKLIKDLTMRLDALEKKVDASVTKSAVAPTSQSPMTAKKDEPTKLIARKSVPPSISREGAVASNYPPVGSLAGSQPNMYKSMVDGRIGTTPGSSAVAKLKVGPGSDNSDYLKRMEMKVKMTGGL